MRNTPFAVVLTGGIASGKSAVADHFSRLRVPVIDADLLAHALVTPGQPALAEIVSVFGTEMLDAVGCLDRRKLRSLVFAQDTARRQLEGILHPRINKLMAEHVASSSASYVVLAIPLYVDVQRSYAWANRVLVTDVPRPVQVNRLIHRPQIDIDLAERILAAQASRDSRLLVADDVIDNTGPIKRLNLVVQRLHHRYLSLAQS